MLYNADSYSREAEQVPPKNRLDVSTQSLMRRTMEMLRLRRQSLVQIQINTGIPYYWLRHFLSREIRDPGVNRVQILYEYLATKKLDV